MDHRSVCQEPVAVGVMPLPILMISITSSPVALVMDMLGDAPMILPLLAVLLNGEPDTTPPVTVVEPAVHVKLAPPCAMVTTLAPGGGFDNPQIWMMVLPNCDDARVTCAAPIDVPP